MSVSGDSGLHLCRSHYWRPRRLQSAARHTSFQRLKRIVASVLQVRPMNFVAGQNFLRRRFQKIQRGDSILRRGVESSVPVIKQNAGTE